MVLNLNAACFLVLKLDRIQEILVDERCAKVDTHHTS